MKTRSPLEKVIITAAVTGSLTTRQQCPHIPFTPQEIADEAVRSYEAGATIAHVHAREADGSPSWRPELFQEILEKTRARCPILLNFSTGGQEGTVRERSRPAALLKPEIAALNMGSMNYAIYSQRQKKIVWHAVFLNPFDEMEYLAKLLNELRIIPELECFDAGHISNAEIFIEMNLLKPPFHFSLILGVAGGIAAKPRNLKSLVEMLPEGSHWQLSGIGEGQWPLVDPSLDLGGHIRIGLEDNFYLPNGTMAKSNAELVEAVVQRVQSRGQKVANINETRKIMMQGAL